MTSSEKHHRHPPLNKPSGGEWGRQEFAFLGAPCNQIRQLSDTLTRHFIGWKVCYVDADHADADTQADPGFAGHVRLTDKIHSWEYSTRSGLNSLEKRRLLADCDVILVNGNHFTAASQILLLHSGKLESLQRKTDRLTNVIAVLELDTSVQSCPWLHAYFNSETKVFTKTEEEAFIHWFRTQLRIPEIRGLVLAGGRSTRMGSDKSRIAYHGQPQRKYLLSLFRDVGIPAFLSCRADQVGEMQPEAELIVDRFTGLGPYGAILSALMSDPDSAWLVIATDLPFVNSRTLRQLTAERSPAQIATAFHNPDTGFPEPLIALWEPKAYPVLLSFLAQGISCPRKALINSDVHILQPEDVRWLRNVNTPEEMQAVQEALR